MPGTERGGGGLARWNEPTLSRMAFEFLRRYIAYKRTSSLLEREALEKKNSRDIQDLDPFSSSTFRGSLLVRSSRHDQES